MAKVTAILAAIDIGNEAQAREILETADKLAVLDGARLDILTVVPPFGMPLVGSFFPKDYEKDVLEKTRQALEAFLKTTDINTDVVEGHVSHGTIYEEIIRSAKRHKSDLIVLGAHRPELSDYLLGPNAARVVRHAPQSVYIVRD